MNGNLRFVILFILVFSIFLPLNVALALVVNPPLAMNTVATNNEKVASFEVLTLKLPGSDGSLNSGLNPSLINLQPQDGATSLGIQGFSLSSFDLNVRGNLNGLAPTPIPTSVLLLGTGLIGLIVIARRSFFTR